MLFDTLIHSRDAIMFHLIHRMYREDAAAGKSQRCKIHCIFQLSTFDPIRTLSQWPRICQLTSGSIIEMFDFDCIFGQFLVSPT